MDAKAKFEEEIPANWNGMVFVYGGDLLLGDKNTIVM